VDRLPSGAQGADASVREAVQAALEWDRQSPTGR
jgi:hypothetical protein